MKYIFTILILTSLSTTQAHEGETHEKMTTKNQTNEENNANCKLDSPKSIRIGKL